MTEYARLHSINVITISRIAHFETTSIFVYCGPTKRFNCIWKQSV